MPCSTLFNLLAAFALVTVHFSTNKTVYYGYLLTDIHTLLTVTTSK